MAYLSPKEIEALDTTEIVKRLLDEIGGDQARGVPPLHLEIDRERSLDEPSYFITHVIDPWYVKQFDRVHYQFCDEVVRPYLLGESFKIDGSTFDPKSYTGLMIQFSRDTLKSTMLRWMSAWASVYWKERLGRDLRQSYVHKVLDKAKKHSEALRLLARHHDKFRSTFPRFAQASGDWDTIEAWRWPGFSTFLANEWSYVFYGETSNKTGTHTEIRWVDDWVDHDSCSGSTMLDASERNFKAMDHLGDRSVPFSPQVVVGTPYHYDDVYARLERSGSWIVWKVPAHAGTPKTIFDLASLDPRDDKDKRRIEVGLRKLEKERPKDLNFPKRLPWRELYRSCRATRSDSGLGSGFDEYATQKLLNPSPEGDQRFRRDDMDRAWTDTPPRPDEAWAYIRVDPAISKEKQADETAINVGLVRWDGHRFYVDGWVGKERRPTEQVRKIFGLARRWEGLGYKVFNIGIEAQAYQAALASLCRDGVPQNDPTYEGEPVPLISAPCPIVAIHRGVKMSKQERILQMCGPVERGEVHVLKTNPIGRRLVDEHVQFPFGRKNILDTCYDMWQKVLLPPKEFVPRQAMAPQMRKLFKHVPWMRGEEAPRLADTTNPVTLQSWGDA